MSILLSSLQLRPVKTPNFNYDSLVIKNNFFVIKDGLEYKYYKITVDNDVPLDETGPIIRFDKHPPIIHDGIVILQKRLFRVTMQDIMRGVIRKSREIKVEESILGTAKRRSIGKSTDVDSITISSGQTVQHQNQQGISNDDEAEIIKQADLYWKEQTDSLLHSLHQETGGDWEISDITQPRPNNEVSAV